MWPSIAQLPFIEYYEHFAVIDSTSSYAAHHSFVPRAGLALFVADMQSAGRGQRSNTFFSDTDKGLWATLLAPVPDINDHFTINRALCVSIARAIAIRAPGCRTAIKWPNDIYINDRKICGILLTSVDGQKHTIAAGFGINANLSTNDFPRELRPIATSLLIESGATFGREELLRDVLTGFDENRRQNSAVIHAHYASMLYRVGARIEINDKTGAFDGVLPDGRLCLKMGAEREYIVSGTVTYL